MTEEVGGEGKRIKGFNPPKGETPQVTAWHTMGAGSPIVGFNPPKGETPQVTRNQDMILCLDELVSIPRRGRRLK